MAGQEKGRALKNETGGDQTHEPDCALQQNWLQKIQARRHQRRTEKYHQSAADRAAKISARATVLIAVLAVVTGVAAIFQYLVFAKQLTTMDGQLAEMKATRIGGDASFASQIAAMREQANLMQGQLKQMDIAQRPWIRLAKKDPIEIVVVGTGVLITLDIEAENVGHSPATNTRAIGRVFPSLSLDDERAAANSVCKSAVSETPNYLDQMIFPGEMRPIEERTFPVEVGDIINARARWIADQYAGIKSTLGQERAEAWKDDILKQTLSTSFDIVGCITYSYRDNEAIGQTAFILQAYRPCGESPIGECAFNIAPGEEYGPRNIRVKELRRGIFAK